MNLYKFQQRGWNIQLSKGSPYFYAYIYCMHLCIHICIYAYAYLCIYMHMNIYLYMYVCMTFIYICMYVCAYVVVRNNFLSTSILLLPCNKFRLRNVPHAEPNRPLKTGTYRWKTLEIILKLLLCKCYVNQNLGRILRIIVLRSTLIIVHFIAPKAARSFLICKL